MRRERARDLSQSTHRIYKKGKIWSCRSSNTSNHTKAHLQQSHIVRKKKNHAHAQHIKVNLQLSNACICMQIAAQHIHTTTHLHTLSTHTRTPPCTAQPSSPWTRGVAGSKSAALPFHQPPHRRIRFRAMNFGWSYSSHRYGRCLSSASLSTAATISSAGNPF